MPADATVVKLATIGTLKGGRNGADPPFLIPRDQCIEAQNVDWNSGAIGRKRPGCDSTALTGGTAFTSGLNALIAHLPSADETLAELWAIDRAGTPLVKRLAGGTTWANVSMVDAISSRAQDAVGISFNGKLFLAFKSAVDRLHVWDPLTNNVRRVGLKAPTSAPTSSTAAGAVTDTRTYKSAVLYQIGGITFLQSELSPASSGVAMSAQKTTETLAGAPSEIETHWALYGASTDNVYKLIGTAAVGNTIEDNNASLTGVLAPLVGTNSLFPSVKYLAADENRILGLTAYETTTGKYSRVFFTPPFVNPGDDERVPQTTNQNYYIDLSENDGGFGTGIAGPLQGSMWVFKYRQIWKLTQTGSPTAPYDPTPVSRVVGCIEHKSIVLGRDENGNPALYFLSAEGPYRIGSQGVQYMGRDVEDIWKTVNLDATNKACHGIYHADIHQVWWWVATGTSNDPDTMIVYDTILGHAVAYPVGDAPPTAGVRRGWAKWTGDLAGCRCSAMFSATIGASMSRKKKPYAGLVSSLRLLAADSSTATDDAGTAFLSYFLTAPSQFGGKANEFDVSKPFLWAKATASVVSLELQLLGDFGLENVKDRVVLAADKTESRCWHQFENMQVGGIKALQVKIGDPSAQSVSWELDEVSMPIKIGRSLL